ncbi:hypothetical protein [Sphingomonas sp. LK11]|uniref:hypothetical protein n=1 Tax=Sphingomonas sp. LK11 TaxID=1390395 RepID=UPI0012EC8D7A|nr:hypothetical protein [Sphingomonas sp. LK11]
MTRGIDLTQLNRVATAGEPRDSVPVTRRFLAQVYAELHASRGERAALDYDAYTAGRSPVGVPGGDTGAVVA